jgi:hypothetical protein
MTVVGDKIAGSASQIVAHKPAQNFQASSTWARMKESEKTLYDLKVYKTLRMRLLLACAIIGVGGLLLAVVTAEMCRYGYVPSPEEVAEGMPNPYDDPGAGCREDRAPVVLLQTIVMLSSGVLGVGTVARGLIQVGLGCRGGVYRRGLRA